MMIDDFRRLALATPEAEELNGLGYPNFRTQRKSFATIEDDVPVIKLTRDQQAAFMARAPGMFAPTSDGWGKWGSTIVQLDAANEAMVRDALATAWRNVTGAGSDPVKIADVACVVKVSVPDTGAKDEGAADVKVADVEAKNTDDVNVADDAKVAALNSTVVDVDVADAPDAGNYPDVVDVVDTKCSNAVNAAAANVVGVIPVDPPENLQNVIERLQLYWGREPTG
jgi:hypothetical protein